MLRLLLFIFFFSASNGFAQSVNPIRYWTFDNKDVNSDEFANAKINAQGQCNFQLQGSAVGKGISLGNQACLLATNVLKGNCEKEFSVEFLFKGKTFSFTTLSTPYFLLTFKYPYFLFKTSVVGTNGKIADDSWVITLNGAGKSSYNYYVDNEWHHVVFTGNSTSGKKTVWLDGELLDGFSKQTSSNGNFVFDSQDGFRFSDQVDEIAIYNRVLSPDVIKQHFNDIKNNNHYSFSSNRSKPQAMLEASLQKNNSAIIDAKEFAPGYPNYSVQALDQLQGFPLPRYNAAVKTDRNFSWMDISYLHREYPGNGASSMPPVNPGKAVVLTDELAKYWNYYVEVPCLRSDSLSANQQYGNSSSLFGALVKYANEHSQYPVSTTTFQAQITPAHAGFNDRGNLETSQHLPDNYYLRDAGGNVIKNDGKKWLSPLASLDIIQKDGQTTQFYLRQLLKYLKNTPAVISENGELFGHMRSDALLKTDPNVKRQMESMQMNNAQYSGWFQYRLDSTYKAEILKLPRLKNTNISFYNVSAFNNEYWPDYAQRRKINLWNGANVLSTPDFYPLAPDNWQNKRGAWNGYGEVARGRQKEIAMGDNSFSPFVAAGWQSEEQNIRPAQWLGLLKSMVMLGADFFYVGYFNVTGAGGKWPNGVGPNDPRGYIYQAAMPAYAQAIASLVPEFFNKGVLLNPNIASDKQFRFDGSRENELILVRKLNTKYLVYGSLQPNSNTKGNVPEKSITTIDLEGKKLTFEVRRQGSVYVLDLSTGSPVFYQLDAWHQYEHPYYWSKDIQVEAELYDNRSSNLQLITDHSGDKYDFSTFVTSVVLEKNAVVSYTISARNTKTLNAVISVKGNGTIKFLSGNFTKSIQVNSSDFKDISVGALPVTANGSLQIKITSSTGKVQLDKISLKNSN